MSKMTVKELSEVSEQKLSNSSVCSSAKSNMYVVCGVVMRLGDVVNLDAIYKTMVNNINKSNKVVVNNNIFEKFEKEFSRSLSPMEYEIINDWLDKNVSEEIILGALKEATYNGVTSLRYIDKIIYDWTKKGFKTMEDVNNHLKSRNALDKNVKEISDYNWLDE